MNTAINTKCVPIWDAFHGKYVVMGVSFIRWKKWGLLAVRVQTGQALEWQVCQSGQKSYEKSLFSCENRLFASPFGGDKRDRTADLLNAIQALSQLSYTPEYSDFVVGYSALHYKVVEYGRSNAGSFLTFHAPS